MTDLPGTGGADASTGSTTTVLLVDDHQLVRAGLAALLDSTDDLTVVGQAADGEQAVEQAAALRPDVVLMDLSMPVVDGVEATRRLVAARPGVRVVVLTSFSDHDKVTEALRAGAIGYLLKDCEPAELLAAVRSAARGHVPLDPRVARALLPGAAPRPIDELSAREQQVLRLVGKGMANKQIGRVLGISESTVKVHVGNVFRRIGVADRTSAALWAREHLPDPTP
ncbi:response regulator [Angustibacter aerolatus]